MARQNHRIVEMIIMLSNQLGLHAIAEGVETEQPAICLKELGYEFA